MFPFPAANRALLPRSKRVHGVRPMGTFPLPGVLVPYMLWAREQVSGSHFDHAQHIPGLCSHREKLENGPEGKK